MKKKLTLHLIALLTIFTISCGSIPEAPIGDHCIVRVLGKDKNPLPVPYCKCARPDKTKYSLTLEQCNNFRSVSPSFWGEIQKYIKELRRLAEEY